MNLFFNRLQAIGAGLVYWLLALLLAISMEGVALWYQHGLGYAPCALCIHVRLWVLGLIMAALLGLWWRRHRWLGPLAHLLYAGAAAGMLERSWMLIGTERGTIFATCAFDLGLPEWIVIDRWFPALFEVRDVCGYTPPLPFGLTMAEGLVPISVVLLTVAVLFALIGLIRGLRTR